ncbi:MAG: type II secretion system protein GspF [Candidatus Omnitrophica bacterium CG1_02_49_10]|nr:MAG: type II secretion system protein GspF [Candidatus Omnitrophica bacterium CG1_02_49_10]
MPIFEYIAKNQSGNTVKGDIDLSTREDAIRALREKDLTIISISETAKSARGRKKASPRARIKEEHLVIFTRQLSSIIDAGIPIVEALNILTQQVEAKRFKEVLSKVEEDVRGGKDISDAFSKWPKIFDDLYVNMVRAGEASGALDDILDRLASYLEKANSLKRKVKTSLIYPAVVITMAIGITLFLMIRVIPVFKEIFSSMSVELPLPTQILIGISDALIHNFWFGLIAIIAMIMGFLKVISTERGRFIFDKTILKLPVFGSLLRKVAVARFTRTFSALVKSGVPILTALDIVGKTSGNKVVEKSVLEARSNVKEGETISEPLRRSGVFPPMVVHMIAVGEKTGELEKMLSKIADFYDEQVDAAVSGLMSAMEPLIILFLGLIVGGIVIAMFLPIFKLGELVKI